MLMLTTSFYNVILHQKQKELCVSSGAGGESIQSINYSWTRIRSRDKYFKFSKSSIAIVLSYPIRQCLLGLCEVLTSFGLGLFCMIVVGILVSGIQGSTGFILSGTQDSRFSFNCNCNWYSQATFMSSSERNESILCISKYLFSSRRFTQPADIDVSPWLSSIPSITQVQDAGISSPEGAS